MSIVLVATVFPIPEHRAKVIAALETAIKRVHGEPGIERYALLEGPDRLVMIEKYESKQASEAHFQGPALADLMSSLQGKLAQSIDVQTLTPHPAGDPQKGSL
jgi:quinol monooxygenase YgiN